MFDNKIHHNLGVINSFIVIDRNLLFRIYVYINSRSFMNYLNGVLRAFWSLVGNRFVGRLMMTNSSLMNEVYMMHSFWYLYKIQSRNVFFPLYLSAVMLPALFT